MGKNTYTTNIIKGYEEVQLNEYFSGYYLGDKKATGRCFLKLKIGRDPN